MRTRPAHRLITRLALALTLAVPAAAVAATSATADDGNATVTVVHGIPDTPVDVYVDGSKALSELHLQDRHRPDQPPGRRPRDRRAQGR